MKLTMRFIYLLLFTGIIFSCQSNSADKENVVSFLRLKDSFAMKNLTTFVMDSSLRNQYKTFNQIKLSQIDSTLEPVDYPRDLGTVVYLYSWQERDSLLTEFTTVIDKGEFGLRIVYFVLDKNAKVISSTEVAGIAGEGGVRYEIRSSFIARDTLSVIHAASTDDDKNGTKSNRRKGDSTFYNIIFFKNGKTLESKIREKKELNL
jgi:hypothetical protein